MEVLLAAVAVVLDLLIPTIVILALAGTSLALRREELGTLGLRRAPHPGRMAAVVFGLVVGWQLLTLGLVKPILNHLTGITEDLSQFADLQGNLGLEPPRDFDSAGEFRLLVGVGPAGRVGRSSLRSLRPR